MFSSLNSSKKKILPLIKHFKIDKFSGFCVNDDSWVAYGRSCDQTISRWSDSAWAGFTSPKNKRSDGKPNFISNASKEPSNMSWSGAVGTSATGNPLLTTNYSTLSKWGSSASNKWASLTRPDAQEKSSDYEGEYSLLLRIVSRIYTNVIKH